MDSDFIIKEGIQRNEALGLLDFLNNRIVSECLNRIVQEKTSLVTKVYRGLKYRKKDLYVGHTYKHRTLLSSWSKNRSVAMNFALDGYVPESMLEEVACEKGYAKNKLYTDHNVWEECEGEFINLLLVCENISGFFVNKYLQHPYFSKEEEVIVHEGKWSFEEISYQNTKEGYSFVEAKTIWLPKQLEQAS